jgi:hypothetical protein
MPLVSDMIARIREQAARLFSGENLSGLPTKLKDLAKNLGAGALRLIQGLEKKLWALLPGGLREKLPWLEGKLAFIPMGLVLVAIMSLVILAAGSSGNPAEGRPAAGAGISRSASIPLEDLFLPDEPDFLPPVILGRERREAWTAEDAEPFWYKPPKEGETEWRERVEQVIDELLERVP